MQILIILLKNIMGKHNCGFFNKMKHSNMYFNKREAKMKDICYVVSTMCIIIYKYSVGL